MLWSIYGTVNSADSGEFTGAVKYPIVKVFVFKHDPKSELGLMLKQWVVFIKLEYFNSILN